jgi:hypothetical protein
MESKCIACLGEEMNRVDDSANFKCPCKDGYYEARNNMKCKSKTKHSNLFVECSISCLTCKT